MVGLVGGAIVVLGLVLVPFPGPGWLVVLLGLAVLASEFAWAARLQHFVRRSLRGWAAWLRRQPWPVRALTGLGTLAVVLVVAGATMAWLGPPDWLPDGVVSILPGQ